MNQEQIKQLAKQAGGINYLQYIALDHDALNEFVRLVRESALEDAAEVCVTHSHRLMYPSTGNAIALMCANDIKVLK